jgi:DNA-binding CsgD family transcriptional regulator
MVAQNTLRGRDAECAALDVLLDAARRGESRTVVLRGETGVGKTALLDYAIGSAQGFRVLRSVGVESEMELAFASLHQLCAPILDRRGNLPGPQKEALEVAFGLDGGPAPDRFLVGLATLSLLAEIADQQPLLCVIDDAQWLDRASALAFAFVARRLLAEPIGLLFAVREPVDVRELAGLPQLTIGGLSEIDARVLLDTTLPGRLDERVRDRIVAESRGIPLALLELPRGLTPGELAGGFALPDARPLASRIERSFLRQVRSLPPDSQRLLLTAAAEPFGDVSVLWRAADRLGLGPEAAAPAEAAGLLQLGALARFRHPLVRSAVYRAASLPDRQDAHRALADSIDADIDPDRRAWHRARAAPGPDEDVAVELERSAGRAQARGGIAAAAAFLERAATLTQDPARRAQRALDAAQAKLHAGAFEPAAALLAMAEAGPPDERRLARMDLLRAQIAASGRGRDAPPLLLKAARQLERLDLALARETYRDAFSAALFVGRLASGGGVLETARAARAVPPSAEPARAADLLLDGLALAVTDGFRAGAPILKRALSAFRNEPLTREETIRWLYLACRAANYLWDDETWELLCNRQVQGARDAGALSMLPGILTSRIGGHLIAGEFNAAAALVEEVDAVTRATGSEPLPYGALALAAWAGRETEALELIESTLNGAVPRGEGFAIPVTSWAKALLCNSLGRYEEALAAARVASDHPEELDITGWGLIELIEAAARTGKAEQVVDPLGHLTERTRASGSEWALGIEARSRALLSEGETAEGLYREAIERLGTSRAVSYLARTHLVYGEWLRRENRRVDAREQLRVAHDVFGRLGAGGFAERARTELLATGENVRRRTSHGRADLTPQETQIARLALEGLSNPEIGTQLFISPRTVQYHLHKVFLKLDITSRTQLSRVPASRLSLV